VAPVLLFNPFRIKNAPKLLRKQLQQKTQQLGTGAGTYRLITAINNKKTNMNSLKGLHIRAQGCGTPLPWVNVRHAPYPTLKGLRTSGLRNPFRVQADCGPGSSQGSGTPLPWALLFNPFRIKNAPKILRKQLQQKIQQLGAGIVRLGTQQQHSPRFGNACKRMLFTLHCVCWV